MRNFAHGGVMVFDPPYVQIDPGDSVRFVATDKGHDASSIESILPAGAVPFAGTMSQDVLVSFPKPGLYGIKCTPHFGMGMVALIKVGAKVPNQAEASAALNGLPGLAKSRMASLLQDAR